MKDTDFNLIDEPWIKVSCFDGKVEEKLRLPYLFSAYAGPGHRGGTGLL